MTKREREQRARMMQTLCGLGFSLTDAMALRRISMRLHRWHEKECGIDGGCIERDEKTGKPYWHNSYSGRRSPIRDDEKGALAKLKKIEKRHAPLTFFVQTDPRGAALYVIRPGDVPEGENVDAYYSRGVVVY
jgi:hypothetical protein